MKYVQVSKALYDYDARTEDEITVKENDILYVIEKEDDDWWKAQLKQASGEEGGPVGLVPAQYLEEVTPIGRVRAEYDYQAQQEEELSFEEGDEMDLLERDDPDWYLVKHSNGQVGLAPSNYVQFSEQFEIQEEEEEEGQQQAIPVAPPVNLTTPTSIPSPVVQPVLSHSTGHSNTPMREMITDDAQSWTVHEYDPIKKKKKKGKGNLFIGNGMLCYGSETDKASPVQQYPILDVKKYLFDSKNLHIEVEGDRQAVLDFQASSKSEAKAILVKISDSIRAAQSTAIQVSPQQQVAAPAAAIVPAAVAQAPVEDVKCEPKWGISIYDFHAEGGDELSVAENEQVYVLDYVTDDGWWRVQKVNGEVGLVPSSYVEFDRQEEETAAPRVDQSVEEIRRQREQEERELQQRRIAEEQEREERKRREEERRREEEERVRREQEENRRREEERRRQEAAAAAKRAEAARLEEENRRKSAALSRSLSTSSSKSTRQQDLPKPDLSKIRTWTDRTGAFRVEAQFVDFHNGKLRLHKLNGVKIDVPAEKMSPADLDWVNQHLHKTPASSTSEEMAPPMPTRPAEKKMNENWDWFDWFMTIGIPHQASLQYASAFKADKLDDSDIPKLTHKQMKTLGLKEEHVQRVERFIETGQSEDPEEAIKEKQQSQIEKDEELARRLQREFDEANKNKKSSTPAGRPRPSVSAPKDVHPDLLEFIGNQLTSNDKGKEPEKPKNDLSGFTDDAWAPRSGSSPIPTLTPIKATPTATSIPPPAPAPPVAPVMSIPTGPTPEELRAQEAERKRIAEEEQIQKIKLMNLQRQAEEQQRQLEELQKLTKQQLELQKQLAMQTGTQQQQQQQQQQMQQIQLQQQQLQHQLAQQPAPLQPSLVQQPAPLQPSLAQQPTQLMSAGRPRPVPNHRLSSDPSLGQWQAGNKPTGFQANQPTGFQANQPIGFQTTHQHTGFQTQPQPTGFQSQQQQQQPFQTGFQQTGFSSSQPAAWQNQPLQPQMTGFPPSTGYNSQPSSVPVNSVLPPPLVPTAAGQSSYNSGIQRSHTIAAQPTGRHWNNATPDNPFGSPTLSPLQAQMTGVQFSTPSPNAFNHSPIQSSTGHMQPQMTGAQPPATHSIFTPQGSMQYGQSAFPGDRRW